MTSFLPTWAIAVWIEGWMSRRARIKSTIAPPERLQGFSGFMLHVESFVRNSWLSVNQLTGCNRFSGTGAGSEKWWCVKPRGPVKVDDEPVLVVELVQFLVADRTLCQRRERVCELDDFFTPDTKWVIEGRRKLLMTFDYRCPGGGDMAKSGLLEEIFWRFVKSRIVDCHSLFSSATSMDSPL